MMVTFDRGDYWQCAYVIAKGQYDQVKARGLEAFRADVVSMAPILKKVVPGAAGLEHPVIEGAGHFLQEDAGERLGTVIADFVRTT